MLRHVEEGGSFWRTFFIKDMGVFVSGRMELASSMGMMADMEIVYGRLLGGWVARLKKRIEMLGGEENGIGAGGGRHSSVVVVVVELKAGFWKPCLIS